MALNGSTNEQKIWNFLAGKGLNSYGVAGLMGNLYAESALTPNNLQNTGNTKLGLTDAQYTSQVDAGTYTNFATDGYGYGLAQWTYKTRKAALLSYVQEAGASVGDLETQLNFLYKELSESYAAVLTILKTATSVLVASNAVLTKFEKPADQSSSVQTKRAGYGQTYYDKYAGTTEEELRQSVADAANSYIGCKESDGTHKPIIDLYNSHTPLARSYKVQYTDAWCATFISAIAIKLGLTDIIPTECSCEKMIELFSKLGRWKEDDSYKPSVGDVLFYDWDDTGSGDDTGASDHVGFVVAVSGTTLTITEGNKNDAVAQRTMTVNGKYIRGYGLPDYASKATAEATTEVAGGTSTTTTGSTSTAAASGSSTSSSTSSDTVYTVAKGDTLSSIAAKYGTTYKVLADYNGISDPNKITVGQKIKIPASVTAAASATFAVGDVVQFAGGSHYSGSGSTKAASTTLKAGPAKITKISSGAAHPYHIVHTDSTSAVYGWVDASTISKSSTSSSTTKTTTKTHTVVKGDTLSAIATKYGTTVAKIVAANKSKYSKITANYIVIGWVLTIPQ